jgi:hypothetical protein
VVDVAEKVHSQLLFINFLFFSTKIFMLRTKFKKRLRLLSLMLSKLKMQSLKELKKKDSKLLENRKYFQVKKRCVCFIESMNQNHFMMTLYNG